MTEDQSSVETVEDEVEQVEAVDEVDADESDVAEGETEEVEDDDAEDEDGESKPSVARLENEGDIAADYLEELLDIADLDGDIDLDVESDRALVAVVGGGLDHLVGADGEVLEALQELTRLAVYRETGERSRLMLDIAGHRAQRRSDLITLTEKIVEEVRSTGQAVKLEPMSPFERKVVHDTVAAKGLTSESEGEEPERRVVVQPA
ncbi:Jag family protein [Tenggerimyces flavus]|uniref:Protein jag n=1 Tax=Tenggerimyces flavus TaxID=1708749 RepID=A0ABV7YG41_9ACTN|nr:R3H domain-containing nucleic acid-binding protein [Tenggerimyces flavus]MBM7784346.1 spoIIIJ-associated protein [Tenggerimyces flavus]